VAQVGRPGLSPVQKRELWQRWKSGQSLSEIGRALGKHTGSVHGVIKANGGFVPPTRRRRPGALSTAEREEISRGLAGKESFRRIAARLGRPPSTISREVGRHGGAEKYRAARADERAWANAQRPQQCLLARNLPLQAVVAARLAEDWSPQQISGWLVQQHPADGEMRVSAETIYRSLFVQARGVLAKKLIRHLRSNRMMRRAKRASYKGRGRGGIIDAVSITERPAHVEDRTMPGHWEGDLITGSKNTHIATLVERQSRFVMLVKVQGKDTARVVAALIRQVQRVPASWWSTLTWDRGVELADHRHFTAATGANVYFCDPHSPWQRGSNENTNGLLRQYFPKSTDLSPNSQHDLDAIAAKLNNRPRKSLGYRTPTTMLHQAVALTG
jgi:IS30 family transposase